MMFKKCIKHDWLINQKSVWNKPGYFQRGIRRLVRIHRQPCALGRRHAVFDAMCSHRILFFRPFRYNI